MNVRKAQKHMQRATDLMEQGRLGFGFGTKRKFDDLVVGDGTSELGKRPREDELVPGFARQIGPTCYLNAVLNFIFKCLNTDEKLWENNVELFEFLQELYFSNKSIRVEPALQKVRGEFVEDRSVESLQQSGTRNLFGKDFNKIFIRVHNALYDTRTESYHDRIGWDNKTIRFEGRSTPFLLALILLAHGKLTYVSKRSDDFKIQSMYWEEGIEVQITNLNVQTEQQVIEKLSDVRFSSRYIFCTETYQDLGHADEFQTCFLSHAWLMKELPMRFAGSIVKLISKKPGAPGHTVMAYPVSTPFTPGTDIMICDSRGKPCEMSYSYDRSMKRTIRNILFIYRPTKYTRV